MRRALLGKGKVADCFPSLATAGGMVQSPETALAEFENA